MFKYIYVFILIVILFGIKWKLQKKYEFKEEFFLVNSASINAGVPTYEDAALPENKLADMFSSSDGTQLTFYDKLNIINSNIKFDTNLTWNLDDSDIIWFEDNSTNSNNRIELLPPDQGIGIGDNISSIHDKVLTNTSVNNDKLSFQLQRFELPSLSMINNRNFANFNINSNNTSNINESLNNLKSWHNDTDTHWYQSYTKFENKKMTNKRDVFESTAPLFDGSTNPDKVFANANGQNEADRCETEGIEMCNTDSDCKMLHYFYYNGQSMCTLMKYKDGKDFSDINFSDGETSAIYWAQY